MGKNTKSQKRDEIFNRAWQADVDKVLKLRVKFPRLESASIFLPFGWVETSKGKCMFSSFATEQEFLSLLENKSRLRAGFMRMFIRDKKGRKIYGLEQTFPAKVESSYISKKDGFIYRWTDHSVTITKMLGTTSLKKTETQISSLLDECKRFLFMYCSSRIELIN